jgi:hypothetical protein
VATSGAEGDRTPDLSVANAALSHLSYGPKTPMGVGGWTPLRFVDPRVDPPDFQYPDGRDRIRTCDLYDVNVAL